LQPDLDAVASGAAPESEPRGLNPAGIAAMLAGVVGAACATVPELVVLALPAAVAAVGLGVVGFGVARRARKGRPAAVAGIVLGVLAAVVSMAWLVLLTTEAEFTEGFRVGFREALRDEGGVFALRPGDCFELPDTGTDVGALPLVPCDRPHDAEVFAAVDHPASPGAPFPGPMELVRFAYTECEGERFTRYVGTRIDRSMLDMDVIYPEQMSWRLGERTIVCFLFDPEGPRDASARDSGA
jgi:hypothetical protein